jgi:hypothetical protein
LMFFKGRCFFCSCRPRCHGGGSRSGRNKVYSCLQFSWYCYR